MPNAYFQFKKFKINQEKTAMKVGTDGLIFGAWISCNNYKNILDIGTGTGLLALMLAQKNDQAIIDAIDIDDSACEQAKENFLQSPWPDRLNIIKTDFKEFSKATLKKYDLIVSNPPFFSSSLLSKNEKRNLARHQAGLDFKELINGVVQLLETNGECCVIIPYEMRVEMIKEAMINRLYCCNLLKIKPNSQKDYNRIILVFKRLSEQLKENELIIRNENNKYTPEYKFLTKDFYLDVEKL